MTTHDFTKIKDISAINEVNTDVIITDIYICDLLSWVAGHVKKDNTALITINSSYNVIAVASLLNISVIVFCDDVMPRTELITKANEEGIALFSYPNSSYELAKEISKYEI